MRLLPEVDDVYVFPHMGDGGLALGAAIARVAPGPMSGAARCWIRLDLGPDYDATTQIDDALRRGRTGADAA